VVRAHEGLLRPFVGCRVVAEEIAEEPAHTRCFPIEDHAKRLRIAGTRPRQQLLIGIPVAGRYQPAR
jgi:hypothetical protein